MYLQYYKQINNIKKSILKVITHYSLTVIRHLSTVKGYFYSVK